MLIVAAFALTCLSLFSKTLFGQQARDWRSAVRPGDRTREVATTHLPDCADRNYLHVGTDDMTQANGLGT